MLKSQTIQLTKNQKAPVFVLSVSETYLRNVGARQNVFVWISCFSTNMSALWCFLPRRPLSFQIGQMLGLERNINTPWPWSSDHLINLLCPHPGRLTINLTFLKYSNDIGSCDPRSIKMLGNGLVKSFFLSFWYNFHICFLCSMLNEVHTPILNHLVTCLSFLYRMMGWWKAWRHLWY